MTANPTGTVTFLFTDIENSTRLAREHPDTWEVARARHHAILRGAIEANHGFVFQIIGDAFCAAFPTADGALRAATKSQTDLHSENWGDTPIKVRMGIHTGKAEIQQDGQYHGYLAMSRVQRLMSAGHGGQVLISAASQELLLEDLPADVSLRDLGERRLKDLIRPEHIYQLVIPGLPIDFPPLKTLDLYRHNLPVQLTSFIGREKEIEKVKQILSEHRLVTLTGVGGTGKTRLALQVAADVVEEFGDGVWLVELAALSDPELVPQVVATTFGLREHTGRTFIDILKDYLSEKKLLLVLDNCEHMIEACAQLSDVLLHTAPHLKILATSREALGITGESTYPVQSLSLPDTQHLSPALLNQYDAVRLFIDRATAVQPDFQVTNQNAPAVAQVCARLDGIPLAIELAGARVKGLSPDQIASRLDDRFRLLTGGSRTALPRQRTLQATIDWSYRLVSEGERMLMQCLSVFAGGWTVEAAEHVCAGENLGSDQILDLLLRLVDKSLVVADVEAGESRYHMLETIRQYAQEKLDDMGGADQVRDRHLDYYRLLAKQAKPQLTSFKQLVWLDRLKDELDNIRASLEWAQNGGSAQAGLRLANDMFMFWIFRAYFREPCLALENLLASPNLANEIQLLAQAHRAAGWLQYFSGDVADAQTHAEESERLALQLGEAGKADLAIARNLANSIMIHRDPARARLGLDANLNLLQEVGDRWEIAQATNDLGSLLAQSGDLPGARQKIEQALALFQECGDQIRVSQEKTGLARIAMYEDKYAEARTLVEEVHSFYQQTSVNLGVNVPLWLLGVIAIREGEYARARRWYTECLLHDRKLSIVDQFPECFIGFAGIAYAEAQFGRAAQLIGAAEEQYLELDNFDQAEFERLAALLSKELGDETFEKHTAEGRAMTREQAVSFALEEISE